jgi:DNA-binding Lrp family transcriptional regulator
MHAAFIMMTTQKGAAWDVAKKISKMRYVKLALPVTGPYDVIAYVEAKDLGERLKDVLTKIHAIDEVEMTITAIAVH